MKKPKEQDLFSRLRDAGHRATPGRVAILKVLESSSRPLSMLDISKNIKPALDDVTIYRALEALSVSGLVRKVDFQHPHAHYEMVIKDDHHHHLVCNVCGAVEDLKNLDTDDLEKMALSMSKTFNSIRSHSLELFGVCNKCSKSDA